MPGITVIGKVKDNCKVQRAIKERRGIRERKVLKRFRVTPVRPVRGVEAVGVDLQQSR